MLHKQFLFEELGRRQVRNSRYSLRSYARDLGISPTLLSQLLSGKRPLTYRSAALLSRRLFLSQEQERALFTEADRKERKVKHTNSQIPILSLEEFEVISDWEYYAVLGLANLDRNRDSSQWISRRLRITPARAKLVLRRLEKLGYIERANGQFRQKAPALSTTRDIPSSAIQKYHRQNLDLAAASLAEHSVDERYFGSMTLPIDPSRMNEFKKVLRQMKARFERIADRGPRHRVYHFSLQLFPVDGGDELKPTEMAISNRRIQ